ncbi:nitroreductase family protein [Rhodococcus koreensis]
MTARDREELLNDRYGDQPKPKQMIWNDHVERLLAHRSVRNFLSEPLPEGALETLVAAAQSASASSNLHQWSVVAVSDPEIKAQLAELSYSGSVGSKATYINEAPVVLLWVADTSRNHEISTNGGGSTEVYDYLDAFLMASIDTALAAQNAATAAESIGLGVCFLGVMRNQSAKVAELIGLPKYAYVTFGMCIGIPDPVRPSGVRPRPRQDVVLHHNSYNSERPTGWLEDYEKAFLQFRELLGMKQKTWAGSVRFATTMPYMDGRENLRDAVEERGYLLR